VKKAIVVLLVLLVLATPINDVGRYLSATYTLDNATQTILDAAQTASRGHKPRNVGGGAAVSAASAQGVTLYGYDQNDVNITVWTEMPVTGTWVIGPYMAWKAGKPLSTPFLVKSQATGLAQ
jgi:hypothetical protein